MKSFSSAKPGFRSVVKCHLASVLTATIIGLAIGSMGGSALAQSDQPTLLLNGTWQFEYAANENDADALANFYQPNFDTSKFQPTPVPSNWALQGYEPPHYKPFDGDASQGFYLEHFTVPVTFTDKRVLLKFGGVWSSAEVWLNGKPLGRHDSGYTSFGYDVTSSLKVGGDNVLAVRVRQVQHDYLFDTNDDWTLGGIYRDVSLEAMPKDLWIDRVDAQTTFDDQYRDADLKVRVMVADTRKRTGGGAPTEEAATASAPAYDLRLTLVDGAGKEVQTQVLTIPPHRNTDRDTGVTLHVQNPLHWTAETPNLYQLRVDIVQGGKVTHERTLAVGFRQISTAGGIFKINGQVVKLRGVNRHDEYPDVGRATTPDIWLKDIQLMKAANINFVRMSHYPPAAGFLDLCDKLGMYVDDEVPMGGGGDKANDPSYASAVMLRAYETVTRDINHPSIILWSVGNEDPLTSLHMASIRTVKGLDPTRPVLMPWRAESWLPPEIDILAPHYYTAQQSDELAARANRPIVTTEYTHAYGNDGFGGLQDRWNAITRHPAGAGGAIWMWADQGLRVSTRNPDGTVTPALKVVKDGWDGITDSYRNPTRDYWETKAVYAQVYPGVDRVAFVPGQASVRVPIQNDFDFTDLKDVKISWVLMEDDRQLAKGTVPLSGQPHATSWLDLPLDAIKTVAPGATNYVQFTFARSDGSEITRRSVELIPPQSPQPVPSTHAITVQQSQETVVRVGDFAYTFSPKTGQLVGASLKGAPVVTDLRPTLWRPLTPNETYLLKKDVLDQLPDLNSFTPSVVNWQVAAGTDKVNIKATVNYVVNDKNRFKVTYEYDIGADGVFSVRYSIDPTVLAPWLPFVGMTMTTAPETNRVKWLGLGPLDAFPNENSAPILGVWPGAAGSPDVTGTKATRWVEVTNAGGQGLHIVNDGYMNTDAATPGAVRILSSVAGRSTKFNIAENPAQQLKTSTGIPFVGQFSFALKP